MSIIFLYNLHKRYLKNVPTIHTRLSIHMRGISKTFIISLIQYGRLFSFYFIYNKKNKTHSSFNHIKAIFFWIWAQPIYSNFPHSRFFKVNNDIIWGIVILIYISFTFLPWNNVGDRRLCHIAYYFLNPSVLNNKIINLAHMRVFRVKNDKLYYIYYNISIDTQTLIHFSKIIKKIYQTKIFTSILLIT